MNPEKELKKVACENCKATAVDNSKHRGRFQRRHQRDAVCLNYARRIEEGKAQLAAELLAQRIAEGAKTDGTRVDMSGDAGLAQQVANEVLPGGVA